MAYNGARSCRWVLPQPIAAKATVAFLAHKASVAWVCRSVGMPIVARVASTQSVQGRLDLSRRLRCSDCEWGKFAHLMVGSVEGRGRFFGAAGDDERWFPTPGCSARQGLGFATLRAARSRLPGVVSGGALIRVLPGAVGELVGGSFVTRTGPSPSHCAAHSSFSWPGRHVARFDSGLQLTRSATTPMGLLCRGGATSGDVRANCMDNGSEDAEGHHGDGEDVVARGSPLGACSRSGSAG